MLESVLIITEFSEIILMLIGLIGMLFALIGIDKARVVPVLVWTIDLLIDVIVAVLFV